MKILVDVVVDMLIRRILMDTLSEMKVENVKEDINKVLAVNARFYLSSPERKLEKIQMQRKLKS